MPGTETNNGLHRGGKVSELVAREILEDTVARDLEPGTMLPSEAQMLEQYQVGRASLREALRILEVHGLIRVKPGPGGGPMLAEVQSRDFGRTATFYFKAKRARFLDLLEARLVLEPIMARMAAQNARAAVKLEANLAEAEQLLEDPGPRWGQISNEFHSMVGGLTGNPVLDLVGSSLNDIHADRVRPIFPVGSRSGVLRAHKKIAEAIISGDADQAEHLSRRHIQELIKRLKELNPNMLDELIDWH